MSALSNASNQFSFVFAFHVTQKITKATEIHVFTDQQQVFCVKFKTVRVQLNHLVHAVKDLNENGRNLSFIQCWTTAHHGTIIGQNTTTCAIHTIVTTASAAAQYITQVAIVASTDTHPTLSFAMCTMKGMTKLIMSFLTKVANPAMVQ